MQDQEEAVYAGCQPSQPSPDNQPITSTQSNKQLESITNEEHSGVERQKTHEVADEARHEQAPKPRSEPRNEERQLAARICRAKTTRTRCRKGMIRCSGDPGDGSGCFYCQRSGVGETHYQVGIVGSKAVLEVKG
jgi:hypothetical protein